MKAQKIQWTALFILFFTYCGYATDVTSLGTGKWNDPTTWSNNAIPTANDNVTIMDGHTITLDGDSSVVNNLIIGPGTAGGLQTVKDSAVVLAVFGNLTLNSGMFFKTQTSSAGFTLVHLIYLQGNITCNGSAFDMRNGSSATMGAANFIFFGSTVSTVTMGAYTTTNNEFNGISLNKTGSGKVVLASDMVCAQGSSSAPTAEPYVYFNGGLLVTGDFAFIHLSTTSATVSAGTTTSYILGNMGRAMSSTAGKLGTFPVGDVYGYRPVQVKSSTSGVATGHYLRVNCVAANANTGSSAFPDNLIDKVSAVRYYKVTYGKLIAAAADSMGVDHFRPSYFSGDGIVAGNQDIRVAYSTDNRATWTTLHDNYPDTTKIGTDPFRYYSSDTLANAHFLTINQNALYFTLARLTGTTTNTLDPGNSVERTEMTAVTYNLEQNYPNPFNPATKISYNLPNADFVNLKIYDIVGNEVATLISGYQSSGHYAYSFNASALTSGVYFYTLKTSRFSETKKMLLTK